MATVVITYVMLLVLRCVSICYVSSYHITVAYHHCVLSLSAYPYKYGGYYLSITCPHRYGMEIQYEDTQQPKTHLFM